MSSQCNAVLRHADCTKVPYVSPASFLDVKIKCVLIGSDFSGCMQLVQNATYVPEGL